MRIVGAVLDLSGRADLGVLKRYAGNRTCIVEDELKGGEAVDWLSIEGEVH